VQVYVDPDPDGRGPGFIRIEERHGAPGVAVLPIRDVKIGLVTIFRRNLNRSVLEIPRGFGGEGDGPRSDAVRELQEETGILADQRELIDLGSVSPNSVGDILDRQEITSFDWYELSEVTSLILKGDLTDGFTHAALLKSALLGIVVLPTSDCRN
jgi:ADP-ribose pyrophosphatase YjhB (NUDIX family)